MGKRHREDGSVSLSKKKRRSEQPSNDDHNELQLVNALEASNGAVEESASELTKEEKRLKKERKKQRRLEKEATAHGSVQSGDMPVVAPEKTNQQYEQRTALSQLPQSELDDFLATNFIAISGNGSTNLRPILKFDYLPSDCSHASVFKTFTKPTPIQTASWPYLLAGRDLVGVAETGSGKTLAFGVPCVRHVQAMEGKSSKKQSKIRAVIVSPTRELAMQSHEQMRLLVADTDVRVVCIYGGVPKDPQRAALASSQIIIATPGRLMDFINEGAADLSNVSMLVLDEADRMLDKGFEQDIRTIVSSMPAGNTQTAMFTATWPATIRELADQFFKDPIKITIGDNPTGDLRANTRVTQKVEVIDPREKEQRLLQLLKQYQSGKSKNDRILVFCLYKKEASRIEMLIKRNNFRVAGIHGDMTQSARTQSLDGFRDGSVPILVGTDVAARGLDIPAVKCVINVTFPLTVEDYVHRIGRTGRAGEDGLAVTLFTEHDKGLSGALINVLRAAKQPVPDELLKFGGTVKKKSHEAYGAFYKDPAGTKQATKITFD